MSLEQIKSLTEKNRKLLESDDWTVESLATASVKDLTVYAGIGKATATRIISEAAAIVNASGIEESERLERDHYYQRTPPWKIIEDWEEEGMQLVDIALASAISLAAVKGISTELALRLISEAQGMVNKQNLNKSMVLPPMAQQPATSSAFPVEWLSGAVEPPPMGIRIKRNFDRAKEEYEAKKNG